MTWPLAPGALVVSCQAARSHPFRSISHIVALAECARRGGADALRIEGIDDIRAVQAAVDLPVIGLVKVTRPGARPLITPTLDLALEVAAAGASVVALDLSVEAHPADGDVHDLIDQLRDGCATPILADISTLAEAARAMTAGVDAVATTLSGYTPESMNGSTGPDFDLLARMVESGMPSVLEGRITAPEQLAHAARLGAIATIVGAAITDPVFITRRFHDALSLARGDR